MPETLTILKREIRSYFLSPIAYVVGGAFLGIGGYFFFKVMFLDLGQAAEARMTYYFALLPYAFLILGPALAMRLWAEERKQGTLELLLTYPMKTGNLVLGKFLAALLFIAILLFLTLGYPITLSMIGNFDWGPALGGYLAALLLGASYLSFGLFASSLTRDQIVALILSVAFLGLLDFCASNLAAVLFGQTWAAIFAVVSPGAHFSSITRGVLDLGDLLYYLIFCGFFLFLNGVVLEVKKKVG